VNNKRLFWVIAAFSLSILIAVSCFCFIGIFFDKIRFGVGVGVSIFSLNFVLRGSGQSVPYPYGK
jgi:hypothetical protein